MLGSPRSGEIPGNPESDRADEFRVIDPDRIREPLREDRATTKKRKRRTTEPLYQYNCRFTRDEYELLCRLARNTTANAINKIIVTRLFRYGWRDLLETLRAQHRKLGFPDTDFYPRQANEELGIKKGNGRRPRPPYKKAA